MGRAFRFAQAVIFCVGTVLMVAGPTSAQEGLPTPVVGNPPVDPVVQRNIVEWKIRQHGVPDDWTHHYLVFSNPGTAQQAIESGKYDQWLNIVNDHRFTIQQIKRTTDVMTTEGMGVSPASRSKAEVLGAGEANKGLGILGWSTRRNPRHPVKKDWNVPIGGVAASGIGTVEVPLALLVATVPIWAPTAAPISIMTAATNSTRPLKE